MYAVLGRFPQRMVLDGFTLSDSDGSGEATLGEELRATAPVRINLSLSLKEPMENEVVIRIIRGGEEIRILKESLPTTIDFVDDYHRPGEKTFYRVIVEGGGVGKIVANPVFVNFKKT